MWEKHEKIYKDVQTMEKNIREILERKTEWLNLKFPRQFSGANLVKQMEESESSKTGHLKLEEWKRQKNEKKWRNPKVLLGHHQTEPIYIIGILEEGKGKFI